MVEHTPDDATSFTERNRSSAHIPAWAREWQRKLFDAGWLVPGNPPEYGGRNASLVEQFVAQEELGRRRIYPSYNPQGLSIRSEERRVGKGCRSGGASDPYNKKT